MFTGLKNKIKEETGGDVGKIVDLVSATLTKPTRHSRHGSNASLGSFSIDGTKEDVSSALPVPDIKLSDGRALTTKEFKKLESKEDEWRRKLQKKDDECKKKLEEKDRELQKVLEKKEQENSALLSEIRELQTTVKKLEDEVLQNSEYKTRLCQYQEDLDQLEGFQSQEMAKVKHLLLQKEQLLAERETTISQQNQKISDLTAELRRLQDAERSLADTQDRLETLRHESETEKAMMTSRLAAEEESSRHLKDRLAVLEERYKAGCVALGGELTIDERVQGLLGERALYERLLAEAHEHLSEVKTTWSGKITSLETQVERLCRQASEESDERRSAEKQRDELSAKLQKCENETRELMKVNEQLMSQVEALLSNQSGGESVEASTQEQVINEEELTTLKSQCSSLTENLETEKANSNALNDQLTELQKKAQVERRERDELLLRNAQVSQEVELVRQQLRSVQKDADDMHARMGKLQAAVREQDEMLGRERIEKDILTRRVADLETAEKQQKTADEDVDELRKRTTDLEEQVLEKNKTLKNLQQRLSEMKKTMAKELKVTSRSIDPGGLNGGEGCIPPHGPALLTPLAQPPSPTLDPQDINFKYLKHVLFKFLTCREYEAQHLTRAVSTLLRFTAEEERLLKETLDWRSSWFGSRPSISGGAFS